MNLPRVGIGCLIVALGLSACQDGPTSPADQSPGPVSAESASDFSLQAQPQTLDAAWRALDRGSVPGFAGVMLAEDGTPIISLTEEQRGRSEAAARSWLRGRQNVAANREPRFRYVEFSFSQLSDWRDQMMSFADLGAVLFDADEARNGVTIGVERESDIAELRMAAVDLGVPERAVFFRVVGPGRGHDRALTLNDIGGQGGTALWKPTDSGAITFCTLGVTGYYGGQPVMVTASHCSALKFETDTTTVFQQLGGSTEAVADELWDPTYSEAADGGDPDCWVPPGVFLPCRWSDAAVFSWKSSAPFAYHQLARTERSTTGGFGSRTLHPSDSLFLVTDVMDSYDELWAGVTVQKIGDRTGWTEGTHEGCIDGQDGAGQRIDCDVYGNPVSTCFNYRFDETNTRLRCQFEAFMYSDEGDSGAPVFQIDPLYAKPDTQAVKLVGLVWGGPGHSGTEVNDERYYSSPNDGRFDETEEITWFSPWIGVKLDLETSTATFTICRPTFRDPPC